MRTRHTTWISTLSLITALGLGVGCGDDDDNSGGDTTVDAGGNDAGTSTDASTDAGAGGDAGSTTEDAGSTSDKTITELVVAGDDFSALEAAVLQAELAETLSGEGPFTVFAPTNAAFTSLLTALGVTPDQISKEELTALLTYHVVPGAVKSTDLETGVVATASELSLWVAVGASGVTVNDASVTTADIIAKNGVIHVIDKVMVPPNIVEFAGYTGLHTTLIGAAGGFPDIVEALTDVENPVTLFAPTDAAFEKLDAVPSGDALKSVLLYHAVAGEVLSTDLANGAVPTVNGASVTISGVPTAPKVNDATIGPADIVTTSGVIHVVDTVLVPPT